VTPETKETTPYNRVAVSLVSDLLSDNPVSLQIVQRGLLILSIPLFLLLSQRFVKNQFLALFSTALYALAPAVLFMTVPVSSDIFALFFLLLGLYLLFKNNSSPSVFPKWISFLFLMISFLFRVEYLLILVPFLLTQQIKRKTFLILAFAAIAGHLVIHLPIILQTNILSVLQELRVEVISIVLFATFVGLILLKLNKEQARSLLIKTLGIISLVLFVVLLIINPLGVNGPILVSALLPLILILFQIVINNNAPIFKSREFIFLSVTVSLFFLFYKSLYFQHLIVIIPFMALLTGMLLESLQFTKNTQLLIFVINCCLLVAGYKFFFGNITVDYPQFIARQVTLIASEYDSTEISIFSYAPQAMAYYTGWKSYSLSSSRSKTNSSLLFIVSTDQKGTEQIPNYVLVKTKALPEFRDYSFYEENLGYNTRLYVNIYRRIIN